MQLCGGLAAGGAGVVCECVAVRRMWFGVVNQTLFLKSTTDTITKDLASFLCIAVGCRKGCGWIKRIQGRILAIILIADCAGIHWAKR